MDKDEQDVCEDADLTGDYARDKHRGGYGDDYAREDPSQPSAARGDTYGVAEPKNPRRREK